jgi:heme/copper-type cytochrome/quinol oxidase subunit 1
MAKIVFTLFLPPIIWLLYGAPPVTYPGNLALLLVVTVHLYVVLWQEPLFALFQGDAFTYGFVARGINGLSFGVNFFTTWFTLFRSDGRVETLDMIPSFAWGVIGLSILLTLTFPILTSRKVTRLPRKNDRREFEHPGDIV